uniref:Adenylate cyclase 10 n=1 Tax=Pelusios castaneus TaxID=367368 RepID=A0A8C8R8M7_9SAUR
LSERKSSDSTTIGKVAAHVPDLIVYGDFSQELPFIESFDGVLLFADISGFTALTEKFSMDTSLDHGADQLTQTLNHYVGDIVEEVLIYGGDILNFAGDALLALWKVERSQLSDIITLALKCSLRIQEEYGVRETEVGLELRVKIGLSAGHISKVVVGDSKHQYFLVIGRAVDEVRLAQNLAKASEVILSPNCWELCNRNMIEIERIKNQRAVKARYIKNIPQFNSDEFFWRCTEYLQHYPTDESSIFLFQIDDNQPLEYLSELRPVTIVFVNLQFDESANTLHLCKAIHDANMKISEVIQVFRGKINKVFMFDKGCTFLCVFGLPGDKQADESTHALECAFKIFNFCSVRLVSIGVTSGPAFCGVVGHRVRHEYTVIGRKVNLAARMMMHYPGLVSCDAVIYSNSKLPHYFFEELPQVEMKGFVNPGLIYHYLGITEKTMIGKAYLTRERSEYYPLLGREKELDIYDTSLKGFVGSTEGRVIMYEGLMGYGKSQLLAEIAFLGQEAGHRVVAMELTKINVQQNFFAIRTLMAMFLGIDACKSYDARQHILQGKLRGVVEETYYCLLNNIFLVKFPTSAEVSKMDSETKNEEMEIFLVKILQKVMEKEILIFVIDEAQFIDPASWEFLDNLLSSIPVFMVMALCPPSRQGRLPCVSAANVINSTKTIYVQLRELKPSVILQKACQDLGVVSIPWELEMFLIERSHGIPFYCEELLRNLHLNNMLVFHLLEEDEEIEDEWEGLFSKLPVTNSSNALVHCILSDDLLGDLVLVGIALAELDNMSPSEQMVVKCAAIIGQVFTTDLLLHILPEWTKRKMNQTLAALVDSRIFDCYNRRKDSQKAQSQDMSSVELLVFSGTVRAIQQESEQQVMQCGAMAFYTPLLQKAAYEVWLKSQKKALHLKCVSYLERQAHKCKRCGEGDFISFHRYVQLTIDQILKTSLVMWESFCPFSTILSLARAEDIEKEFLQRLDEIIQHSDRGRETIRCLGSCECEEIVESVFVPLARHCMAMGEYSRALYYLLECAAAYLHLSNNYMAYCSLNTAESLIKSEDLKETVINQFEEATFYSLKSEVCFNMGQMSLAKKLIKKALSLLNRSFPFTLIGVFFKNLVEVSKHASHQKKQEKKLAFLHQQGHCLSLLWQLFSLDTATNSKKFCRLAALMKVNSAEESEDESQIISSYTEFSLCCQMMGWQDEWMKYELMAIQRSSHLQVIGGGLLTTVKLAQSLAYMKLCLGNLPLSIQLGKSAFIIYCYRAHEMCVYLKKPKMDYLVLCMLFKALFLSIRFQDCVQVLSWLEELAIAEEKIIGMACFFSYCLELLLYAGFSFKTFKECLDFIQENETNCILMSQNSIMLGLYSSLAIWFARLQQWSSFKKPFEKARRLLRRSSASFFATSGFCRFLECEVLVLRKHIESKPQSVREIHDLDHVLSRCSTSPIYYPTVYHLKAYVFLVLGNEEQSQIYLSQALELCDVYGNLLEKSWLEISNVSPESCSCQTSLFQPSVSGLCAQRFL